jgi:hypothetical protein
MKDELLTGAREPRAVANWDDVPRIPAQTYTPPPTNLPESVSAAQIATENRDRWYNIGPGDRAPLAGTTVPENDGGGK